MGCFGKGGPGTDDTGDGVLPYDGVKGDDITLCGEGTGCDPVSRIVGTVIDSDGVLLDAVTISLSSGESATTETNGSFEFLGLDPEQTVIATFTKDGYTPRSQEVTLGDWRQFDLSISLSPVGQTFTFDNSVGGSFAEGTLSVEIAAEAFYYEATGEPVTGEVTLHVTAPDVGLTIKGAPGDFVAIDPSSGDDTLIHSYGFFDIQAWQDGEQLNLVSDEVVSIHMEITDNLRSDSEAALGETIPFWWWNLDTARWEWVMDLEVQTGEDGERYVEADLPHFSSWNCDDTGSTSCVDVLVQDVMGNPIDGALISLEGTSYSGSYSNYSENDDAGVPLLGLASSTANLSASMTIGGETYTTTQEIGLPSQIATSDCPETVIIEIPICIAAGSVAVTKISTVTTAGYSEPILGGFGYFFEPDGDYDFCSTGYSGMAFDSCDIVPAEELGRSGWGIDLVPAGDIVRVGNDMVDIDLERTSSNDEDVYYSLSTDDVMGLGPYVQGGYVFDITLEGEDGGYPGITDEDVVTMPETVTITSPDPEGDVAFDRDENFEIEYVAEFDPMGIFVTIQAQTGAGDNAVLFCRFNDDGNMSIPSSDLQELASGDSSVMLFRADEAFFEMPYGYAGRANTLNTTSFSARAD
jgi:hypothetical protein